MSTDEQFLVLETQRLVLRPLRMSYLDEFVALHDDAEVARFIRRLDRPAATERLRELDREWEERGHGMFAVHERGGDRFLGRVGFKHWPQFQETELGWVLRRDAWKRGYATEAAEACAVWASANLELPYLTAMIDPRNAASIRVAHRLGMRPIRSDVLLGVDVTVYALQLDGRVAARSTTTATSGPRMAPVEFRSGIRADADSLARAVVDGFEGYRSFAPPGWTPISLETEAQLLRGLLTDDRVWCRIAEEGGELVGHATFLPVSIAYHPADDPKLAHLRNLFVRRDHWGTGLARSLHAAALAEAGERGFTRMRLFVPEGQARARRFYEREGWAPAGEPFHDDGPDLRLIEYRCALSASRA